MNGPGVAVVGFGHWGPNIARNLHLIPGADLIAICDFAPDRLLEAKATYPYTEVTDDFEALLGDPRIDAVVVATPAATHRALAGQVLASGRHVFVEKPLALTVRECDELIDLAARKDLVLMVGHTFRYNAAVRWIRDYVDDGELGKILYLYTQRLNLGKIRQDVNVMWNLAPHDVSIITHLAGEQPSAVTAHGRAFVQQSMEDVAFMVLEFPNGVLGHVHVGWLDPQKVRSVTLVGSKRMVVYDDTAADERLRVYDKGVEYFGGAGDAVSGSTEFGEFQLKLRSGDLWCPRIDFREPLRIECEEFVDAIVEHRPPLTGGDDGRSVVLVLEAAQRSLERGGQRIVLAG